MLPKMCKMLAVQKIEKNSFYEYEIFDRKAYCRLGLN